MDHCLTATWRAHSQLDWSEKSGQTGSSMCIGTFRYQTLECESDSNGTNPARFLIQGY